MNQEIKRQWIDALRSGEYKQTQECLRDPSINSYCCLGVLCDLYIKGNEDADWVSLADGNDCDPLCGDFQLESSEGFLPEEVIKWAGISDSIGGDVLVATDSGEIVSLTELNDLGVPFGRIADYIENSIRSA